VKRSPFRKKPPDPEKVKAKERQKRKRVRAKRANDFGGPHGEWVRERGCEVPGCEEAPELHHQPYRSHGGTAKDLVGLCANHHRTGRLARHKVSLEKFNREHGTDLLAAAARNWRESPYGERKL
jgi:hypothetical protein